MYALQQYIIYLYSAIVFYRLPLPFSPRLTLIRENAIVRCFRITHTYTHDDGKIARICYPRTRIFELKASTAFLAHDDVERPLRDLLSC